MSGTDGMFSGLFSEPYPTDDEVMAERGDKFLTALVSSVRGTRGDIRDMREWRPDWFPTMHSRCLSNVIHDRIWARLVAAIESDPATKIIEKGPTREIAVGLHRRLRIKRHLTGDKISTYPTEPPSNFGSRTANTRYQGWRKSALRSAIGGIPRPVKLRLRSYHCATGRIT
nr:hypothetical protein [Mycobacterium malmoense]